MRWRVTPNKAAIWVMLTPHGLGLAAHDFAPVTSRMTSPQQGLGLSPGVL
jgi:predicted esterase